MTGEIFKKDVFMEEVLRAELSANTKKLNTVKISIVLSVSVLGLILGVFNLFSASLLFAFAYFVAGALGVIYSVIKINETLVPRITVSEDTLSLRTWDNGFLPYNIDFKPQFFGDFVPAKNVVYEIPLSDISEISIGSKGFLVKAVKDIELNNIFSDFSKRCKRADGLIKRLNILTVKLRDGKIYVMNVDKFDFDSLYEIVDFIEHRTQELLFNTNVRVLRRKRETLSLKKTVNPDN